jgi:hypothetical protein
MGMRRIPKNFNSKSVQNPMNLNPEFHWPQKRSPKLLLCRFVFSFIQKNFILVLVSCRRKRSIRLSRPAEGAGGINNSSVIENQYAIK